MQKTNQKEFRIEKVDKRKGDCMTNVKDTIIRLIVGLIQKDIVKMSEYFPEPKASGGRVKIELDLSNYATKLDLNNAAGVGTSKCVTNVDLASLKFNVDKLDIVKLKNAPTSLNNLKSKVDKLDVDKLVPVSFDLLSELGNLSVAVRMMLLKKIYI